MNGFLTSNILLAHVLVAGLVLANTGLAMSKTKLEDDMEQQNLEYEMKLIENVFKNVDDLFTKAIVKVQPVLANGAFGLEQVMTLSEFLSAPNDVHEIINLIEKDLKRKLSPDEIALIKNLSAKTLPGAVHALWQNQYISDQKAQNIILHNAPITSAEIIRLIENGAVKTSKDFVQLRTGHKFGDTLTLFEKLCQALEIAKKNDSELANMPHKELLRRPVHPELVSAFGPEASSADLIVDDAYVIGEMRRRFLFISTLGMPIRFRPGSAALSALSPSGAIAVNTINRASLIVTPRTLSAILFCNHYFGGLDASLTNTMFVNPLGITYSTALNWNRPGGAMGVDWWLCYSAGFLGAGADYTVNFDKGTSWSNGESSYLSFGAMIGGWRNNLMLGFSMSTMLLSSVGLGANITMSVTRSHDVAYLGVYPSDGIFPSIRGLHKIEIDDVMEKSAQLGVALNFSAAEVPVSVAFRVGRDFTRRRIYRTHTNLLRAQDMLSESGAIDALHMTSKKIKETRLPKFDDPEILVEGDELIETKFGRLSGAFILGLETMVPISAGRIGGVINLTAEFELGLQRLPNNKFQVSIKPERVYQMGIYGSILNIFSAGYVKSMAVARKQIFIFDFNQEKARTSYFNLVHHGLLPTSQNIEIYPEERGPEYLLTEFRAHNEEMLLQGVSRTYLEKVKIFTTQTHMGLSVPLLDAGLDLVNKVDEKTRKTKKPLKLIFTGIDREFMRSHADSVATNGIVAVRKTVYGGRRSVGQGFSGRYNQDIFVTHRRIHTLDDSPREFAGNKWQFDSLLAHYQLEDTKITGDEENEMAEKINRLFGSFIGSFEYKSSKALRIINIEREFTVKDFAALTSPDCLKRVRIASQATDISEEDINKLLMSLQNKHPDCQGLMVKHFIETNPGATGFAAIHQLLEAEPKDLIIRTESGYAQALANAKTFVALYSKPNEEGPTPVLNLFAVKNKNNKKLIREFYDAARIQIRTLDNELRLLYDDQYLIDDKSLLYRIYGKEKVDKLIEMGVRQDKAQVKAPLVTARRTILDMFDLKSHGFSDEQRMIIYRLAGKKRLRITELVEIMLNKYEAVPITDNMRKDYIFKRLERTWALVREIDDRIALLDKDQVMKKMDMEYVNKYDSALKEMKRRLIETTIGIEVPLSKKSKRQSLILDNS